ncbi:zinc finger HIT domain-containing 3 [Cryptosporidium sp. chipmunk genotype I]|uniref:zinc finger HIT domain-containing 3 n=1 Tax=Cryptosporidium sp. chipmunk genotype I TaxID=1280935 RepID=UPI00351A8FAB|nr:zinc finger HIT domain-containing 3 [Cryptosporidium sp. chipmunk genotype I]
MEGSETKASNSDKICVICGVNTGKYKFKCCSRNFCSVECFRIHSREECSFKSNPKSEQLQSDQNAEEKHKEIKLENSLEETEQFELTEKERQALNSNERLSFLLRSNPKLVEMIKFIDNSENKIEALARIMDEDSKGKDKLFAEFTELVAESLGEEFKIYKSTYDSIVSDVTLRK